MSDNTRLDLDDVVKPGLSSLPNRINFSADAEKKPVLKTEEIGQREAEVSSSSQVASNQDKKVTLRNIFTSDDMSLTASGTNMLAELCKQEKAMAWSKVAVVGYTDNVETTLGMNLVASRARAKLVSNYFTEKNCFSFPVQIQGLGSARPVADNRTQHGRELNNRVEVIFSVGN